MTGLDLTFERCNPRDESRFVLVRNDVVFGTLDTKTGDVNPYRDRATCYREIDRLNGRSQW